MSVSLFEQVAAGKAPAVVPLTVEQFHRMIQTGIIPDGDAVELIDGVLVRKDRSAAGGSQMGHSPRHARGVTRLRRLDERIEPLSCHLRSQLPVTLSSIQEPEPDGAIVRGTPKRYADHHPGPAEIVATIEVAESSLDYDRTTKLRIYASAGIAQYWIVNIPQSQIELYELPVVAEGRYDRRTDFKAGQTVRLAIDPKTSVEVAVSELLS